MKIQIPMGSDKDADEDSDSGSELRLIGTLP